MFPSFIGSSPTTPSAAVPRRRRSNAVKTPLTLALTALMIASTATMASASPRVRQAERASSQSTTGLTAQVGVGPGADQVINGFGFADAFGQVGNLQAMPADVQSAVVNLLFNPTTGAGLDIVRFGLGGIGGAGDLSGQIWLGQQALSFGVHTFYGDSWSAPADFKTNGSEDNGGYLCGVPGETCLDGDYQQSYADFLAAQAKGFADAGLPLQAVDPVNEPEIGPGYASMFMTPAQAAEFIPYLGRALLQEGLQTKVACCDAEGWANSTGFNGAQAYTQAVLGSPEAAPWVGLITSHGYTSAPTFPLTSERPVWETEWSTFESWDPAWNDGTDASGLSWANRIYVALTQANVNAFLYWWGTTTYSENGDNEGLIILGTPTDTTADTYQASGRLWAFAAFSRFVRPGAVRVNATSSDPNLDAVAFRGQQGTVLVLINNNTSAEQTTVQLASGPPSGSAQPYLTDASDNGTAQPPISVSGRAFTATVPAGAVVSYVITQGG
jgi:O-glycosyl hydrolase